MAVAYREVIAFGRIYEPLYLLDALLLALAFAWSMGGWVASRREAGQYHPTLLVALVIGIAWTTNVWWNDHQDHRWLLALAPFVTLGLLRWRELWREGPLCRITILLPLACLANYGSYAMLNCVGPGLEAPVEERRTPSSGGSYRASILMTGGFFDVDGSLLLLPDRYELSTLLDRPYRVVATFPSIRDVLDLHWESPTSLLVALKSNSCVYSKVTSWHGVKITYRYAPEPQPKRQRGAD